MKYIKGHKRKLFLLNRDTQEYKPVVCLTSTDYSQVLEMVEKNNVCEQSEQPRSISRSVSFSGEVATNETGKTIDDLYQEQELSRSSVSKWRLCGGLTAIGFDAYLTDASDSYGDGDATFSGSLTIVGSSIEELRISFADPLVASILYTNGLISNPNYSTKEELAEITSIGTIFQSSAITSFDELQYFTGVTSLGTDCFSECSSLTSITLPVGVTSLGQGCFMSCYALTSITLPESVTSIGGYCFAMCMTLILATVLPAIPPSLGSLAFDKTGEGFNIKVRPPYVDDYKAATNWNAFADKIFPIA